MDPLYLAIDLQDCPLCGGPGALHEEGGWAFSVLCGDCGCHTAPAAFGSPAERQAAAEAAALCWRPPGAAPPLRPDRLQTLASARA